MKRAEVECNKYYVRLKIDDHTINLRNKHGCDSTAFMRGAFEAFISDRDCINLAIDNAYREGWEATSSAIDEAKKPFRDFYDEVRAIKMEHANGRSNDECWNMIGKAIARVIEKEADNG